ncbi:hypothetical protein EBZ39_19425, partial [bacterium]|nr:hypothetical protein [bacterium]
MAGATGSVLPTNWASGSVSGLTYTISSASTVAGFRAIEWTVKGTALSDGEIYLACEPMQSGSVVAQIPNEYVGSMYCAKVSGTIKAGMVLQVLTQNFANGAVQETKTKDLAAVTGQTFVRIEPNSVKTDIDLENRVNLRLYQSIASGEAIDFTIRVAAPQIEMGVTASPFISTVSGAVSEVRGRPSILVVPQLTRRSGTNLCLQSEAFNVSGTWVPASGGTGSNPAVTANAVISPDGTQNAETVVFNRGAGNTSSDLSLLFQAITLAVSGTYTFSVYVKATTLGDVGKQIFLRAGTGATLTAYTLTSSWVRITRTETSIASGINIFQIGNRGTFTADNSVSVDLWGAQVEV